MHRYTPGGTFGGPIIKDKLFGFVGYQHLHISDQETGDELLVVPPGLSDTNRTPTGLTDIANNNWTTNEGTSGVPGQSRPTGRSTPSASRSFNGRLSGEAADNG